MGCGGDRALDDITSNSCLESACCLSISITQVSKVYYPRAVLLSQTNRYRKIFSVALRESFVELFNSFRRPCLVILSMFYLLATVADRRAVLHKCRIWHQNLSYLFPWNVFYSCLLILLGRLLWKYRQAKCYKNGERTRQSSIVCCECVSALWLEYSNSNFQENRRF